MEKHTIDWNSDHILHQIIENIKRPLESIISVNEKKRIYNEKERSEIIFSRSEEIQDLIEEVLDKVKAERLKLEYKDEPEIFKLYQTNENVRRMCSNEVLPKNISKENQNWLVLLESEIFNSIKKSSLNLFELSSQMAVSERQLHRKVNRLVYLTPNKYVRILRLHKAKEMIDNFFSDSISQIAYEVGYNDTYYFSTLFETQYGKHPKEFL